MVDDWFSDLKDQQEMQANWAQETKAETARFLFKSPEGEHPEKMLFLTENGGLGIVVSGNVLVMPIERWHQLACKGFGDFPPAPAQ